MEVKCGGRWVRKMKTMNKTKEEKIVKCLAEQYEEHTKDKKIDTVNLFNAILSTAKVMIINEAVVNYFMALSKLDDSKWV
jgi:hypothetical protein